MEVSSNGNKPTKTRKTKPAGADGHRERMRDRLLGGGADAMEDYHILEMLLFFSIPVRDTRDQALALIQRFGSLQGVLDAGFTELTRVEGIGERSAMLIKVASAILRKISLQSIERSRSEPIRSPQQLGQLFLNALTQVGEQEMLYAAAFDSSNRLIAIDRLQYGSITALSVSLRMIVSYAVRHEAASIAIAHNHPDGSLRPSAEDIAFTHELQKALEILDIRLLEHVIVADGMYSLTLDSGLA
ncbi:MAG: DNA repair protein RadC [Clostridia bacterium]|nr:DNA repair protein RadC [Clostridia bacterium]